MVEILVVVDSGIQPLSKAVVIMVQRHINSDCDDVQHAVPMANIISVFTLDCHQCAEKYQQILTVDRRITN